MTAGGGAVKPVGRHLDKNRTVHTVAFAGLPESQ